MDVHSFRIAICVLYIYQQIILTLVRWSDFMRLPPITNYGITSHPTWLIASRALVHIPCDVADDIRPLSSPFGVGGMVTCGDLFDCHTRTYGAETGGWSVGRRLIGCAQNTCVHGKKHVPAERAAMQRTTDAMRMMLTACQDIVDDAEVWWFLKWWVVNWIWYNVGRIWGVFKLMNITTIS